MVGYGLSIGFLPVPSLLVGAIVYWRPPRVQPFELGLYSFDGLLAPAQFLRAPRRRRRPLVLLLSIRSFGWVLLFFSCPIVLCLRGGSTENR